MPESTANDSTRREAAPTSHEPIVCRRTMRVTELCVAVETWQCSFPCLWPRVWRDLAQPTRWKPYGSQRRWKLEAMLALVGGVMWSLPSTLPQAMAMRSSGMAQRWPSKCRSHLLWPSPLTHAYSAALTHRLRWETIPGTLLHTAAMRLLASVTAQRCPPSEPGWPSDELAVAARVPGRT